MPQRKAYQRTSRRAIFKLPTGQVVSNGQSIASTPAGGSTSRAQRAQIFSVGQLFFKATGGGRTSVDLTVYNQNLSLVREERAATLAKGTGFLIVPDVPATIDGTSLHFRSLPDAAGVRIQVDAGFSKVPSLR